ncbi:NmrA domain-containing protein [Favolaschia claudopus]|uniref:NmrA domain-containing protein n=1 Tax=Favolaschia claudopus TaxID=2862362 RepID=A0AAW0E434_9AGAR
MVSHVCTRISPFMPIITIFGANGTQGSAVLLAVLADGKYTPRAVSRSLESPASNALIEKGVEVVAANLWDKESLKKAIRGSQVVFGNTNFWDPEIFPADPQGKGELTQGRNLVDAAKEEGVKLFIYSSLPNATKSSNGRYKNIYHTDNKAIIEDYLRASGVPCAVLLTGWFLDNLWKPGRPALKKTETGYHIPIAKFGPDDVQEFTWVAHDFGQAAVALLRHYGTEGGDKVLGRSFPVVSFKTTYSKLAAAIAKGIKQEVNFTPLETSGQRLFDEMYLFQKECGMYPKTPAPNPDLVALGVKFGTLEEYVEEAVFPRFAD